MLLGGLRHLTVGWLLPSKSFPVPLLSAKWCCIVCVTEWHKITYSATLLLAYLTGQPFWTTCWQFAVFYSKRINGKIIYVRLRNCKRQLPALSAHRRKNCLFKVNSQRQISCHGMLLSTVAQIWWSGQSTSNWTTLETGANFFRQKSGHMIFT
jgi:hypothetical protein